jgi:hypothetical protein
MSDIASALSRSNLASAKEAALALASGWDLSRPHVAEASDLRLTYGIRLDHLRSMSGAHAAQLADAVAELLPNLDSRDVAKLYTISGPSEYEFVVFLSDDATFVLGCLKTVSQLAVSPERWEALWGAV